DHLTCLWTDLAVVLDRSPQVLELLTCVAHRAELFTHAEFCDHPAGQLSCPLNVVTGPGASGVLRSRFLAEGEVDSARRASTSDLGPWTSGRWLGGFCATGPAHLGTDCGYLANAG